MLPPVRTGRAEELEARGHARAGAGARPRTPSDRSPISGTPSPRPEFSLAGVDADAVVCDDDVERVSGDRRRARARGRFGALRVRVQRRCWRPPRRPSPRRRRDRRRRLRAPRSPRAWRSGALSGTRRQIEIEQVIVGGVAVPMRIGVDAFAPSAFARRRDAGGSAGPGAARRDGAMGAKPFEELTVAEARVAARAFARPAGRARGGRLGRAPLHPRPDRRSARSGSTRPRATARSPGSSTSTAAAGSSSTSRSATRRCARWPTAPAASSSPSTTRRRPSTRSRCRSRTAGRRRCGRSSTPTSSTSTPPRIGVIGDSAGGNLAAAVAPARPRRGRARSSPSRR